MAAKKTTVTGAKEIQANMDKARVVLRDGLHAGLLLAGFFLQRESQLRVPVDTGNLKASAFTRRDGTKQRAIITIGYTAAYALFVHELVEMKLAGQERPTQGRFWDPQGRGRAKFLEEPARTLRKPIFNIIRDRVKLSFLSIDPGLRVKLKSK